MDGKGVFTWPDGRKYQGDYKDEKKMDMVYSNGPMVKNIKDFGPMENKMEKENFITIRQKHGENALFKMEGESDGLMNKMIIYRKSIIIIIIFNHISNNNYLFITQLNFY